MAAHEGIAAKLARRRSILSVAGNSHDGPMDRPVGDAKLSAVRVQEWAGLERAIKSTDWLRQQKIYV